MEGLFKRSLLLRIAGCLKIVDDPPKVYGVSQNHTDMS